MSADISKTCFTSSKASLKPAARRACIFSCRAAASSTVRRTLAEHIRQAIHELPPYITTRSNSVNSRGNLLYVDPSQNDCADRLAAAYSVRAFEALTVSTPLDEKRLKLVSILPNSISIQ